jgi:uncharacterized membrane protein YeaQ/YmgE (transglycosylase-associated protein family)
MTDDDDLEPADEELDLSPLAGAAPVKEGPPRPVERTRALLAYLLFGLLAGIVAVSLSFLGAGLVTVEEFTKVMGILLSPVVGLLGAATGYYYGRGDR